MNKMGDMTKKEAEDFVNGIRRHCESMGVWTTITEENKPDTRMITVVASVKVTPPPESKRKVGRA